jgi:hypothetical protein
VRTFEGKNKNYPDNYLAREAAPGHSKSDVEFNNLFDLLEVEEATKSRRNSTEEKTIVVDEVSEGEGSEDKQLISSAKKSKKNKPGRRKGKVKNAKASSSLAQKSTSTSGGDWDNIDWISIAVANEMDAEDEEDELYFMVYCFFKDFNYMREYIQERWCDYVDGALSLVAVSVTTNLAFELLQRSEKEILSQIPLSSGLGDFQSMANMLFMEKGLAHVDYEEKSAMFDGDTNGMNDAIFEEADFGKHLLELSFLLKLRTTRNVCVASKLTAKSPSNGRSLNADPNLSNR